VGFCLQSKRIFDNNIKYNIQMTVMDLKKGESGIVTKIDVKPKIKLRLMEIGLLSGLKITLVRFGPLFSTVEIKVGNFYLAIRKSIASKIVVNKL